MITLDINYISKTLSKFRVWHKICSSLSATELRRVWRIRIQEPNDATGNDFPSPC